ncbi:hypothetical protein BH11PAT4_BH11PAT4_6040 [soil metagenome]
MQEFLKSHNLTALWQPAELLMVRPPKQWELMWAYVVFIGIFLVGAIALLFLKKKVPQDLHNQLSSLTWTVSILGGFLFFFRFVRIPYLGTDLLRLLLELAALIWLGVILFSIKKAAPKAKLDALVQERKDKYLPKAK